MHLSSGGVPRHVMASRSASGPRPILVLTRTTSLVNKSTINQSLINSKSNVLSSSKFHRCWWQPKISQAVSASLSSEFDTDSHSIRKSQSNFEKNQQSKIILFDVEISSSESWVISYDTPNYFTESLNTVYLRQRRLALYRITILKFLSTFRP